jgi:hypothetical protein
MKGNHQFLANHKYWIYENEYADHCRGLQVDGPDLLAKYILKNELLKIHNHQSSYRKK